MKQPSWSIKEKGFLEARQTVDPNHQNIKRMYVNAEIEDIGYHKTTS